jgi:hypothetical protein
MKINKPQISFWPWAKDRCSIIFLILSFVYNAACFAEYAISGSSAAALFAVMTIASYITLRRFFDYIEGFNNILNNAFIVSVSKKEFEDLRNETNDARIVKDIEKENK